ncbi:MAG TPA: hypothetical protein ENN19_06330 [Chloroflexi bacterium]|nr:hypothetical protein [Chloroflexota bacterium]
MGDEELPRRLRVVVIDDETGEEVTMAAGIDTMVLIVSPDTLRNRAHRRLLVGDARVIQDLLLDTLDDVMVWNGEGAMIDLSCLIEDLLAEAVEDWPVH